MQVVLINVKKYCFIEHFQLISVEGMIESKNIYFVIPNEIMIRVMVINR